MLYLASPLNSEDDSQKWAAAAEAAQAVINLHKYELYKTGNTPYYSMAFDKTAANKEIIFERRFSFPDAPHNIHMMWSLGGADGSWNGLYPTQNLVNAYERKDGQPVSLQIRMQISTSVSIRALYIMVLNGKDKISPW